MLFEKMLVLASGLLPEHNPRTDLLQYHEIPLTAATALTSRLGVALELLDTEQQNRASFGREGGASWGRGSGL